MKHIILSICIIVTVLFTMIYFCYQNQMHPKENDNTTFLNALLDKRLEEEKGKEKNIQDTYQWMIDNGVPKENLTIKNSGIKVKLIVPHISYDTESYDTTIYDNKDAVDIVMHFKKYR